LEVVCLGTTPTHHIAHKDGSEADIYIPPKQQQQLESIYSQSIRGARASVCVHFHEACVAKYGEEWLETHPRIQWEEIAVEPIDTTS